MNDYLDRNLSINQKRKLFNPVAHKTIERISYLRGIIPIAKRRRNIKSTIDTYSCKPNTMEWLISEYNVTPFPFMHGVLNDKIYSDNIALYDDNEVVSQPSLWIGGRCRYQYPISIRSK